MENDREIALASPSADPHPSASKLLILGTLCFVYLLWIWCALAR
jgi:hypothetical protein